MVPRTVKPDDTLLVRRLQKRMINTAVHRVLFMPRQLLRTGTVHATVLPVAPTSPLDFCPFRHLGNP